MSKILKVFIIFIVLMVSCSLPMRIPKMMAANRNVCIEGFKYSTNAIFIILSETDSGAQYWESSTRTRPRKRVWMEIYIARDNKIVLWRVINAVLISANPEKWKFEDEK